MIQAKQELLQALTRALAQLAPEAPPAAVFESPRQATHGDLAITAAMPLARSLASSRTATRPPFTSRLPPAAASKSWILLDIKLSSK